MSDIIRVGILSLVLSCLACDGNSTRVSISDKPVVPTQNNVNLRTIDAHEGMSAVVTDYGKVVAWGSVTDTSQLASVRSQKNGIVIDSEGEIILIQKNDALKNVLDELDLPAIRDIYSTINYRGEGQLLAITEQGYLIGWPTQPPPIYGKFISVEMTEESTVVLREDGSVFQWQGDELETKLLASELGRVVKIDAGVGHFIALFEDGRIATWQDVKDDIIRVSPCGSFGVTCGISRSPNPHGSSFVPPENLTLNQGVVDIAASDEVNAVVMADGTVRFWGRFHEDFIPPFTLEEIAEISIGGEGGFGEFGDYGTTHALGLAKDIYGQVSVWGGVGLASKNTEELSGIQGTFFAGSWLSQFDQLFYFDSIYLPRIYIDDQMIDGSFTKVIVNGFENNVVQDATGTVYVNKIPNNYNRAQSDAFHNVKDFAAIRSLSVLLDGRGSIIHFPDLDGSWAAAYNKQDNSESVKKVALTYDRALALTEGGRIFSWSPTVMPEELVVPDILDRVVDISVVDISIGRDYPQRVVSNLALTDTGKIIRWGDNSREYDQFFDELPPIKKISDNGFSFISENDELIIWKHNLTIPDDLGPVKDMAGTNFGLTVDGRLRVWGEYSTVNSDFYNLINFSSKLN